MKLRLTLLALLTVSSSLLHADTAVSLSLTGSVGAVVQGTPPTSGAFSGTLSPACSSTGTTAASTACSLSTTFFTSLPGSSAAMLLTVGGSADAYFGHLGFQGTVQAIFSGGAVFPSLIGNSVLDPTSSASFSLPLDYYGYRPSEIRLSFLELDSSGFDGSHTQDYSVTLGANPVWNFDMTTLNTGVAFPTQTFAVNPLSGSVLLTVSGHDHGHLQSQDFASYNENASLDLLRVEYLDGNGNVIPEPSSITLVAAGIAGLALARWKRRPGKLEE